MARVVCDDGTGLSGTVPRWTGDVRLVPELLDQPLRWRRPRRVFVASMSDPNHDRVPDAFRDRMLAVIALTPHHTYQWLSKRAPEMRHYFSHAALAFRVLRQIDAIEVNEAMRGVAEAWRPLPSAPVYQISNHGRVRRGGRDLALVEHGNGYRQVAICTNGSPRSMLVQRLVLETFDRTPRLGEEAAHRNGDRADNRIANLRWATKGENMQDAARQGTAGVWMKSRATLTADEVGDIRAARRRGELLGTIAARYGISKQQVSAIATGRIFKPAPLDWPLRNLHIGVSVEDQATADARIPLLLQTPAAVRWVSAEPLLGPVDFTKVGSYRGETLSALEEIVGHVERPRLDWIVCGGESGPGARPMHPAWARNIRDQCQAAGVAFLFKQWGAWAPDGVDFVAHDDPTQVGTIERLQSSDGEYAVAWTRQAGRVSEGIQLRRVGKKAAGRLLDGREWNEFPEGAC